MNECWSTYSKFLEEEDVEISQSVRQTVRKLEAAGIVWHTTLHGPPDVPITEMVAGKKILSLGSYEGNFEWRLAKAGAASVLGVEGDRANFAKCCVLQRTFSELPITFVQADIDDYVIKPYDYDIIYCLGVLYHLERPHLLLEKFRASGARFVVITTQLAVDPPHPAMETMRLGEKESILFRGRDYSGRCFVESYIDGREGMRSFWFYFQDLARLVKELGFRIVGADLRDLGGGGSTLCLMIANPWWTQVRRLIVRKAEAARAIND